MGSQDPLLDVRQRQEVSLGHFASSTNVRITPSQNMLPEMWQMLRGAFVSNVLGLKKLRGRTAYGNIGRLN